MPTFREHLHPRDGKNKQFVTKPQSHPDASLTVDEPPTTPAGEALGEAQRARQRAETREYDQSVTYLAEEALRLDPDAAGLLLRWNDDFRYFEPVQTNNLTKYTPSTDPQFKALTGILFKEKWRVANDDRFRDFGGELYELDLVAARKGDGRHNVERIDTEIEQLHTERRQAEGRISDLAAAAIRNIAATDERFDNVEYLSLDATDDYISRLRIYELYDADGNEITDQATIGAAYGAFSKYVIDIDDSRDGLRTPIPNSQVTAFPLR